MSAIGHETKRVRPLPRPKNVEVPMRTRSFGSSPYEPLEKGSADPSPGGGSAKVSRSKSQGGIGRSKSGQRDVLKKEKGSPKSPKKEKGSPKLKKKTSGGNPQGGGSSSPGSPKKKTLGKTIGQKLAEKNTAKGGGSPSKKSVDRVLRAKRESKAGGALGTFLDDDEGPPRRKAKARPKKLGFFALLKKKYFPVYKSVDDIELDDASQTVLDHLKLKSRDLQKLMAVYEDIDIDNSGAVEYREFAKFCGERRNFFSDSMFRLIDVDHNGELSFNEFFQVISQYCLWSQDQILKFVFDTFDVSHTGQIEKGEFERMCRHVNRRQNNKFPGNLEAAIAGFDINGDGMLDFGEFKALNARFKMLLHPIFRLQDSMQKLTLGEKRWKQVAAGLVITDAVNLYKRQHGGALPKKKGIFKKTYRL